MKTKIWSNVRSETIFRAVVIIMKIIPDNGLTIKKVKFESLRLKTASMMML
jgi:hypothetical protein